MRWALYNLTLAKRGLYISELREEVHEHVMGMSSLSWTEPQDYRRFVIDDGERVYVRAHMLANGATLARQWMAQLHKAETARTGRLFMRALMGLANSLQWRKGGLMGLGLCYTILFIFSSLVIRLKGLK